MIDPHRLTRLRKAVHLDVEAAGHHTFQVSGGERMHVVDTKASTCDCEDFNLRNVGQCKHMLATSLFFGDREILEALRQLVPPEPEPPARAPTTYDPLSQAEKRSDGDQVRDGQW